MGRLKITLALSLLGLATSIGARAADAPDPYLWLEDVSSPRVDAWVKTENTKTLDVLERDPRYPTLYSQALEIAEAKDRIPTPRFLGDAVYNFWQDADHVRGIWRKTDLAGYRTDAPVWTTVLDLDLLAPIATSRTSASAWSAYRTAARTRSPSANSTWAPASSSRMALPCPRASRMSPGPTPTMSWSRATGAGAP